MSESATIVDLLSTRLVRTGDGSVIADLDIGGHLLVDVAFSADGGMIVTNNWDQTIPAMHRIWDTASGALLREIEAGVTNVRGAAQQFTPDGTKLIMGGLQGSIFVLDVEGLFAGFPTDETILRQIPAHNSLIPGIRVSPDGSMLLSRTNGREALKLWHLETGEKLGEFGTVDEMTGAFHPTSPELYVPLPGNQIAIYTLDTGELIEIARSRLTRNLTEEECEAYLGRDTCSTR